MKPPIPGDIGEIRCVAEARYKARIATQPPVDESDRQRLRHELEVHQIELEMQNDELQSARTEIEAGLERYTNLFDFAPVGYFNLSADGTILLVNLTGAGLVEIEREKLPGRRFGQFVGMNHRQTFNDFLALVFSTESNQTCECLLTVESGTPRIVSIHATRSNSGHECRAVLTDVTHSRQAVAAMGKSESHLRLILNEVPECVKLLDSEGRLLQINPAGLRMIEADSFQQVENQSVYPFVHEEYRDGFIALNKRVFNGESGLLEFGLTGLKGRQCWLETLATPFRDATGSITAQLAVTRDLTERKLADAIAGYRTAALHAIATGTSLTDTLNVMLQQMEAISPEMYCSVLLFDRGGQCLKHCAAPRLATEYCNAIDGIVIGPDVGSCGTAAFRREQIIVEDIASDPLWDNFRELALKHDLRACWSTPIVDSQQDLLGTFAIYYQHPGRPGDLHLALIEMTTSLVAIAIGRQRSEIELLNSQSRHRRLVQSNIIGVTIATLDGRLTEANDYFLKLVGYTREDVADGNLRWDSISPREWDGVDAKAVNDLLSGADSALFEKEYFHKNGTRVPVLIAATLLERAAGECFCLIIDLTDSKQAEESLRMKDHAIQSITQGILITDATQPDNPIVYVNRGFETITGYSIDEIRGHNCRLLQGKDTNPITAAELRDAVRDGRPCTVELLNYRKDGMPFWNQLSITPVRDERDVVTQFIGVQIDVTARRETESQLLQLQKTEAIGQLASGIAHDFNNLLTIIDGYSTLLLEDKSLGDLPQKFLSEIQHASARATDLTRRLLTFGRQESLSFEVLNVNTMIEDIIQMLDRLLDPGVQIVKSLDPELRSIQADSGQISQLLMNLSLNARDAMPNGGTVTISTRNINSSYVEGRQDLAPGNYVLIRVSDTGCGMSDEVQSRIFDPFFTTKAKGKGTGLGLSTVHDIVVQTGGRIDVVSDAGKGTIFDIYLPQAREVLKPLAPRLELDRLLSGTETILLVEDDEALLRVTLTVLTGFGYHVLTACSFGQAMQVSSDHTGEIDLLLTDIVMPGKNGSQLAEEIRQTRPAVRVVFMSGFIADEELRCRLMREAGFIEKPFFPSDLVHRVRQILDA